MDSVSEKALSAFFAVPYYPNNGHMKHPRPRQAGINSIKNEMYCYCVPKHQHTERASFEKRTLFMDAQNPIW